MRRQTVENPFGTLKAWMGSTHFLTKTFPNIGGQSVDHRARPSVSQVFSFSTSSVRPMPRGGVVDQDAPPCAIPNQRAVQKKTRAQHLRAKPLKVLVGRVGIEPTTNGLRVRGTGARARRKPRKRNGRFVCTRTAAPQPNLCRIKKSALLVGCGPFSNRVNGPSDFSPSP